MGGIRVYTVCDVSSVLHYPHAIDVVDQSRFCWFEFILGQSDLLLTIFGILFLLSPLNS